MPDEKPSVLIIGGLGYIGRFLALHIHEQKLALDVRLVDKVLPQLAWLAPEFSEACSQDKFVQADGTRERMLLCYMCYTNANKDVTHILTCSRITTPYIRSTGW